MSKGLKLMVIAGEPSGDVLAAGLIRALKEKSPGLQFIGIGGPQMAKEGLKSLVPMEELSLMGFTQILLHLPRLFRLRNHVLNLMVENKIEKLLTVDIPGFSFWIGPKAKKLGISHIHYVAPTVWAWKKSRAGKIAKFLDAVLCLFPFEPPYFINEGLTAPFVGHPVIETYGAVPDTTVADFRKQYGYDEQSHVLTLLPGSRASELKRHVPIFLEALRRYTRQNKVDGVFLPTPGHMLTLLEKLLKQENKDGLPPIHIHTKTEERPTLFAATSLALAASGTVTLELACSNVPMVVAYKTSGINAFIARRLLKTTHVAMVNILMGKEIVPEYLQDNCTPEKLAEALLTLAKNKETQQSKLKRIPKMLGPEEGTPTQAAAKAVTELWTLAT